MKQYVIIKQTLIDTISSESKSYEGKKERGGIFIGQYRGRHIEILDMTLPQPNDKASFARFIRQDKHHQQKALSAWKASNKTQTFVGEWHTHPIGKAIPSLIDRATWRKATLAANASLVFTIATPNEIAFFRSNLSHKKWVPNRYRLEKIPVEITEE